MDTEIERVRNNQPYRRRSEQPGELLSLDGTTMRPLANYDRRWETGWAHTLLAADTACTSLSF
jgi:hypothetical protein